MADPKPIPETDEERIARYAAEYADWEQKLVPYWQDLREDELFYQGVQTDPARQDEIPSMTAFAIVESIVEKVMDSAAKVSCKVPGPSGPVNRKIRQAVASVAEDIVKDPAVAAIFGSHAENREALVRSLLVTGNCVAEEQYAFVTDGEGEVVAEGSYLESIPFDRYAFNPAYTWNTSPVTYFRKWANLQDLWEQEYREWKDEQGETHTTGKLKNLSEIGTLEEARQRDTLRQRYDGVTQMSGYSLADGTLVSEYVEDVELLVRWDWRTNELCVIANRSVEIWRETDPFGIGRPNVVRAMLYRYGNRPFGYGEVSMLRGVVTLKDRNLNQRFRLIDRSLKPAVLIQDTNANTDVITDIVLNGGVAIAQGNVVTNVNAPQVPQGAFVMANELEQEVERVARWSAYAAGMPNQVSDKTNGTASGIARITDSAQPRFKKILRIIAERIDTPYVQMALKMAASVTPDDDVRWVMRSGTGEEYSQITKAFLSGKPTVQDLVQAGVMDPQEAAQWTHTALPHPETGEMVPTPIPGASTTPYVNADWTVEVTLDSATAADRFADAQQQLQLLQTAAAMGVPVDWSQALPDIASNMGSDDFDRYLNGQGQAAPQAQGPAQPDPQAEAALQQHQAQLEEQQAQAEHQRELERMQADHQKELDRMQVGHAHEVGMEAMRRIPSVSIAYKDAEPSIRAQMAKSEGYQPASAVETKAQIAAIAPKPAPLAKKAKAAVK